MVGVFEIVLAASVLALSLCLAVTLLVIRARKKRRRRLNNSRLNNSQLNNPQHAQVPLPQHRPSELSRPPTPAVSAGPGWMPGNFDAQVRYPEPIEQAAIRPLEPTPPEVPRTATSVSGEVRQFNAVRAQNGPSLWQFRLERYDANTGQRLKPIAVEMRYVSKGTTHDGDEVTAHGSFDEAGMFQASKLVNHSSRTVVTAQTLLETTKPLFKMMGCYAIAMVIFVVVIVLLIAGAILVLINN